MSCLKNIFKRQHKSVKDRTLEIHNEIEDLKNDVSEAKKVLSSLAKNNANPILAFEAQATLDIWKQQGYLKF